MGPILSRNEPSDETGTIHHGLVISDLGLAASSKPAASFRTEPEVKHTVFVDESGTPALSEKDQPVLSLVGVLIEDSQIVPFDTEVEQLLARYGLPTGLEIHAHPCIKGEGEFAAIPDANRRYQLLRDFVGLGVRRSTGIHYLSMLKPFANTEYLNGLKALKLDPYTSMVVWFNITLQVAALAAIGLANYRYKFDDTDAYAKKIRQILAALKASQNEKLTLKSIAGAPEAVDSRDHRFVQLADVVGYFLTRYRQFEVTTFRPHPNLLKYEPQIREIFEIVRPKVLSFVKDRLFLLIDWKALQKWSLF